MRLQKNIQKVLIYHEKKIDVPPPPPPPVLCLLHADNKGARRHLRPSKRQARSTGLYCDLPVVLCVAACCSALQCVAARYSARRSRTKRQCGGGRLHGSHAQTHTHTHTDIHTHTYPLSHTQLHQHTFTQIQQHTNTQINKHTRVGTAGTVYMGCFRLVGSFKL